MYRLKKPYTQKEKNDFIVKYNHEMGLEIEYTEKEIIAKEHTLTEEEIKNKIRQQREQECFSVINRGQLWYESLNEQAKKELKEWYDKWLEAPKTFEIPVKLIWLDMSDTERQQYFNVDTGE